MTEAVLAANAANLGVVVSLRGSVVDARFEGALPPINSVLRAGDDVVVRISGLGELRNPVVAE